MINADLLLSWMSHTGEGAWPSFRRAVKELSPTDADTADLCRRLRVRFSDLGCADFFIKGTQRWKTLPPAIGGLAAKPDAAFLWGGRSPGLLASLEAASIKYGCRVERHPTIDGPQSILLIGPSSAAAATANDAGLPYFPVAARYPMQEIDPIPEQLGAAQFEDAPRNWAVRSFDLQLLQWVEGMRPKCACEFAPSYGNPQYYVLTKRHRLHRMTKREAVYASAWLQGVRLVDYDAEACCLSVPLSAPLPESFARAASFCSGETPEVDQSRFVHRAVTADIASFLLVAAGQRFPSRQLHLSSTRFADG